MVAGENLYEGDWVCVNGKDGLVYQATWEEFRNGNAWKVPVDIQKGESLPMAILMSDRSKKVSGG